MNAKTIFLFFAVLFVALNIAYAATTEHRVVVSRQRRQFGQPSVVNAQSTATNVGNGGVASSVANAQNTQQYQPGFGGLGGLGGGFGGLGGGYGQYGNPYGGYGK